MVGRIFASLCVLAGLFRQSVAQCPNTLAARNPNLRTMSGNNTWFLVPVPKAKVVKAMNEAFPTAKAGDLTLLDLSSIPGIPEELFAQDMHPILTVGGLSSDIRISALQISGPLLSASTMVPFVSYKGSDKPKIAPLNGYINGENRGTLIDKLRVAGLVPALVSSLLGGIELRVGDFLPSNAAYQCDGTGECFTNSKWTILPNEISGPGIYPESVDVAFRSTSEPQYTLNFWESVINQPMILKGILTGKCLRNVYYFNETTAEVQHREGEVTLGPSSSGLGILSGTLQGEYSGLYGLSACAQNIGFDPQSCEDLE